MRQHLCWLLKQCLAYRPSSVNVLWLSKPQSPLSSCSFNSHGPVKALCFFSAKLFLGEKTKSLWFHMKTWLSNAVRRGQTCGLVTKSSEYLSLTLDYSFLLMHILGVSSYGPSNFVPSIQMVDFAWVPSSCFGIGSTVSICRHLGSKPIDKDSASHATTLSLPVT